MDEIWKDIVGYEGKYQVSNIGRVKSLERKTSFYMDGTELPARKIRKVNEVIMVGCKCKCGYLRVLFNCPRKNFQVHRLVALAFVENPRGVKQVNHKDGDKTNNIVSNLEWMTPSENILHAFKLGLKPCGENHEKAKLTLKDVDEIKKLKNQGVLVKDIALQFKVDSSNIYNIINNKAWRWKCAIMFFFIYSFSFAQCNITIPCNEFDYYAKRLVDFRSLQQDTADYCKQIRIDDKVINMQARELQEADDIIANRDAKIVIQEKDYTKLEDKYVGSENKRKRNAKAAFIGITIAITEAVAILLISH